MRKYDIMAWWRINKVCNFNCRYCFQIDERKNINSSNININRASKFFDNSNLTWHLYISGGEPFMQKSFIELCEKLTRNHFISIDTNLSSNLIYDFANKIDPKKVGFINCSLHISERIKRGMLEDFIDKIKILRERGFNLYITQVMSPEIIKKFDRMFFYLKSRGIDVIPIVFFGKQDGLNYPENYTRSEKRKILFYLERVKFSDNELSFFSPIVSRESIMLLKEGNVSFSRFPCYTGIKSIRIEPNGDIKRCDSENIILGNIFDGKLNLKDKAFLCNLDYCKCPMEGILFSSGNPKIANKIGLFDRYIYPITTPLIKFFRVK